MNFENKLEEIAKTLVSEGNLVDWEDEHNLKYPDKRVLRPLREGERIRFQQAYNVHSVRDSENNVWTVRRIGRGKTNIFEVTKLLGQFVPSK